MAQTVIALAIVLLAAAWLGRGVLRAATKRGGGCACGDETGTCEKG